VVHELSTLIDEARAYMAGCIRQEVLSGIPSEAQFNRLRLKLSAFEDLAADSPTYEQAARFFNTCRAQGIQGSHIDFLICALAYEQGAAIFTVDKDFDRYADLCGVRLHRPRE
jgi:predicted nucleic acid-binding protein